MTVEIVAGRLVAPVLGANLFTWTSVIGVVLAGLSAGNLTGGHVADRWDPRCSLGPAFLCSALATSLIVPALPALSLALPFIGPVPRVVLPISILFGPPSFFMGMIAPLVYRICLENAGRVGGTVGRLAASLSLGSIAGTFATGFWLIPAFGTRSVVTGVAIGLMVLGIVCRARLNPQLSPRLRRASWVLVLLVLAGCITSSWPQSGREYIQESAYYRIKVTTEQGPDGGQLKKLILDNLVHSAADPTNPDFLWYEYLQVSTWVISNQAKQDVSALFIGGGGYTLPHWVERHYPSATVEVIEIDPAVTRIAHEQFVPLSRNIVSHNEDARTALLHLPKDKRYDIVVGDVFNDASVPYHLTTLEFGRSVRARLKDTGLFMANVVDKTEGRFIQAYVNTLGAVFKYVYIIPGTEAGYGAWAPHIVIASDEEVPLSDWGTPDGIEIKPRRVECQVDAGMLTDDYCPVDFMLLDLFAAKLSW